LVLLDNVFQRNVTEQNTAAGAFHTISLDFSDPVAIVDNILEVVPYNDRAVWNNDGETIYSEEGSVTPTTRDFGIISNSFNNSLTLSFGYSNCASFAYSPRATIVAGPGFGQIRNIVSNTVNTFTVDRPWDVLPVINESAIAIIPLGASNWLIKGNQLIGNNRGLLLYNCASVNVSFIENTLSNSYGIWLEPFITNTIDPNIYGPCAWQYNIFIRGNFIYSNNEASSAFISIAGQQWDTNSSNAVITLGVEIKQNTISIDRTAVPTYCGDYQVTGNDGITVFRTTFNNAWPDESIPSLLGTIIQNNTIANIPNSYTLGSGAVSTVITCSNTPNGTSNISTCIFNPSKNIYTAPDENTILFINSYCPVSTASISFGVPLLSPTIPVTSSNPTIPVTSSNPNNPYSSTSISDSVNLIIPYHKLCTIWLTLILIMMF